MKDVMERFIAEVDRDRIKACVREAERRTRGEIVVMLVPASHDYPMAAMLGAAAVSFPAAVALTPVLGRMFWAGPSNMWIFLGILISLFLGCHAVIRRVHTLKRLFIREEEMAAEVREGAQIQFFRKGLYRTREETGVLIYISVLERQVWILADRGIHAAVDETRWKEIAAATARAIRDGQPAEGICRAVEEVGRILSEKFPAGPDDRNELVDVVVENDMRRS
ncbi:TPM domain-containing protein [Desulfococcus multivorans]|uniref:TPM domain-containing protein n=1 Tax=Desulfococcus multivorans DSM 2059 TaxID=1121405 RepID=S7V1C0_DESML|nr:TPM domain-containing protein [Desulfococcus multivorans]AOY60448.1 conserved uncharacterized protein, DUF477 [Desulfococcus multivorans]AQV02540.1 hypothetical protein B2D07_18375 [Desulfococcus multivorans]EPR40274.1 protein of unknown function DUF477 [Desulfococcus multivorans DSM 2059]SJZ61774.1 putative membrane protein [Desulfococcus multivorans DSM 2059]